MTLGTSERIKKLSTDAYMTEAPPPATMVQMRPAGFNTVSFSDAPLLASRSAMYASWQHRQTLHAIHRLNNIDTTQHHDTFYVLQEATGRFPNKLE